MTPRQLVVVVQSASKMFGGLGGLHGYDGKNGLGGVGRRKIRNHWFGSRLV